jgi:hypothetical protein
VLDRDREVAAAPALALPSRTSEEFGSVEVMAGDTVVQFDTTYQDELPAMVASLAPLDLDAELARTGDIAQRLYEDGLYFEL